MLEIRLNAMLMAVVGLLWLGLTVHTPAALSSIEDMDVLGDLEDAVAGAPADGRALVALTDAYLEAGRFQLAIAYLRAAPAGVLEEPAVAHQLARAYEQDGRLLDALATADLALVRCSRVLGAHPLAIEVPQYRCNERTFAKLDTHKGALERMVRWGIVDPKLDPRAQKAYDLALRRARVAIGERPAGAVP